MQLEASQGEWTLSGGYDAAGLLAIKKEVSRFGLSGDMILNIAKLESINAPIIALLLELRRHCQSLTLVQCREDFKEMLQLYGLECIFNFA